MLRRNQAVRLKYHVQSKCIVVCAYITADKNFVGHSQAFPQGSVLWKSAKVLRTRRHYIHPLFCKAARHFQI